MNINTKDKHRLIDALLGCPIVRHRDSRDIVVDDLPSDIKTSIKRQDIDRNDVSTIVTRCQDYPNGLEELVEIIRFYEGDTIHMQKIDKLMSELSGGSTFQRWIRIYLIGNFLEPLPLAKLLTPFKKNIAYAMGIQDPDIEVHRVSWGSIIFDFGVPANGFQHLRSLLQANSTQLRILRKFNVERIALQRASGEIEEWIIKEESFELTSVPTHFQGSEIISLLKFNRLDIVSIVEVEYVQDRYRFAEDMMLKRPDDAIGACEDVLTMLEQPTSSGFIDISYPYTRGKCHLLLASIYLDENNLKLAKEHYLKSINEFSGWDWYHLESLAYLGLTRTNLKLEDLPSARETFYSAKKSIFHKVKTKNVNIEVIKKVIEKEGEIIFKQDSSQAELEELFTALRLNDTEKTLKVYNISTGSKITTAGGTADLNILSSDDYERYYKEQYASLRTPEEAIIDLTKQKSAQKADYILLVDEFVNRVNDGLRQGSWLLVKEQNHPKRLLGKTVVVLMKESSEIWAASLKTFSYEGDHYFLKAQNSDAASIVVVPYGVDDPAEISEYYQFERTAIIKPAYDIRVTGEIIECVSREAAIRVTKDYVWQIPILKDIAAGLGFISEENIEEQCSYRNKRNDVDFGVRVVGDSMAGDDILNGDIALIRQEPTDNPNEIVAIVIITPEHDSLGVLKRHEVVNQSDKKLRHYLLRSSNPSHKHLVVMPDGADFEAIKEIYEEKVQAKEMLLPEFYENAELAVAGKFVSICEED